MFSPSTTVVHSPHTLHPGGHPWIHLSRRSGAVVSGSIYPAWPAYQPRPPASVLHFCSPAASVPALRFLSLFLSLRCCCLKITILHFLQVFSVSLSQVLLLGASFFQACAGTTDKVHRGCRATVRLCLLGNRGSREKRSQEVTPHFHHTHQPPTFWTPAPRKTPRSSREKLRYQPYTLASSTSF